MKYFILKILNLKQDTLQCHFEEVKRLRNDVRENSIHRISAFTLIELVIVIGIIAIFSGMSLASYVTFNDQKKLEQEAKKFSDVLELARKKTSAGDTTMCSSASPIVPEVNYYSVTFTSTTKYNLTAVCNVGTAQSFSYNLPSNIAFSPKPADISFQRLNMGLSAGAQTITFKHTGLSKCCTVSIDTTGIITEVACPVAGSC